MPRGVATMPAAMPSEQHPSTGTHSPPARAAIWDASHMAAACHHPPATSAMPRRAPDATAWAACRAVTGNTTCGAGEPAGSWLSTHPKCMAACHTVPCSEAERLWHVVPGMQTGALSKLLGSAACMLPQSTLTCKTGTHQGHHKLDGQADGRAGQPPQRQDGHGAAAMMAGLRAIWLGFAGKSDADAHAAAVIKANARPTTATQGMATHPLPPLVSIARERHCVHDEA